MAQTASPGVLTKKRRGLRISIGLGFVVLLLSAASAALVVRQRALQAEFRQAREAYDAQRFGLARQRLSRLAERWTNDGEVLFLLGKCDFELGKREDALASWARVPVSSPYFGKAVIAGAAHLMEKGLYSQAESLLDDALADPQPSGRYELELALTRVYRYQGRFHDVRRLIRGSWYRAPRPALVLKGLWGLDLAPKPIESLKKSLPTADNNDDRVWLGRANHAILTGQFAEAKSWLERCLSRRPDDRAVWQAQLELALAAGDVDRFWTAVAHLPDAEFDESEILSFRAWLAARNHDPEREERELSSLVACDPGNAEGARAAGCLERRIRPAQRGRGAPRPKGRGQSGPPDVPPNPPKWC